MESSCWSDGSNLSWLGLRWIIVVKSGWERVECVLQGDSFHAGSNQIPNNGLLAVEHVRACRTDFRRSSGLKSGKARHEHVHQ